MAKKRKSVERDWVTGRVRTLRRTVAEWQATLGDMDECVDRERVELLTARRRHADLVADCAEGGRLSMSLYRDVSPRWRAMRRADASVQWIDAAELVYEEAMEERQDSSDVCAVLAETLNLLVQRHEYRTETRERSALKRRVAAYAAELDRLEREADRRWPGWEDGDGEG